MAKLFHIHPKNPQLRLISQTVDILRGGGLIAYPSDCSYALGWHMGDQHASKEIQRIRNTDKDHNFTLVCRDLSELANYAKVENWVYRLLKRNTPGAFTFILKATREVPRRLLNPKRKTIGLRVPDHPVPQAILEKLGEPMMSSSLILPGDEMPQTDANEILHRLGNDLDAIVDSGNCGVNPTTVIDCTGDFPILLREGKGDASGFI
jgi:tRNA threonylcarbamoyl adenosine modification protein (Sua5/YciO/YrdC/YwlC family)